MLTLVSLVALAPMATLSQVDTVKLVRSYKADEVQAYAFEAKVDDEMSINAEIVFKVKKSTESGADVSMSVRKFQMKTGGVDSDRTGPEELLSPFDKLGWPHVMTTNNESWVYILTSMAGLVPGKEVGLGESFDVDWESKDKVLSAKGKGKALEIVDRDGAKSVKLDYDLEIKPNEESPGHVKCTTFVSHDGSSPMTAEGTVDADGMTIKFSVKRLKS